MGARRGISAAVMATCAALTLPAGAAAVTPSADPAQVAAAMSSQASLITSAAFVEGPSAPNANGVSGPAGRFFPTAGVDFGVLTNGDVANADPPNDQPDKGTDNGVSTRNVGDLTTLRVNINVPSGHNCLGLDFVFYSEEFFERAGGGPADFFLAELDGSDWTYDPQANSVTAPRNFAVDPTGELPGVNFSRRAPADTGLQYDASTIPLRARTPITPGAHALFLTIADAGDRGFDSAAFVDGLATSKLAAAQCSPGLRSFDSDGDGINDEWETDGVDTDGNGTIDLDLPKYGANPRHKDLFVEIDSMRRHVIDKPAIDTVIRSFRGAPVPNPDGRRGINLHVDNGPFSVMNPETGAGWGRNSESTIDIPHTDVLGSFSSPDVYDWAAFDAIKQANFSTRRQAVFRYALSIHQYGASTNFSSGIARGIGSSDFLVSLGRFCDGVHCTFGTTGSLAGTFMHELGHALGLFHGGGQNINFKPNYLSVMNYFWQFSGLKGRGVIGLLRPGTYDYSRTGPASGGGALGTLDEDVLDEQVGLRASGEVLKYRTARHCGSRKVSLTGYNRPVNWNCDFRVTLGTTRVSINNDEQIQRLEPFDDWANIRYTAGALGALGRLPTLPRRTFNFDRDATNRRLQDVASVIVDDEKRPRLRSTRERTDSGKVRVTFVATDTDALDNLVVTAGRERKTARARGGKAITKRLRVSLTVTRGTRVTGVAFDRAANQRTGSVKAE